MRLKILHGILFLVIIGVISGVYIFADLNGHIEEIREQAKNHTGEVCVIPDSSDNTFASTSVIDTKNNLVFDGNQWQEPVDLILDHGCFKRNSTGKIIGLANDCEDLGQAQLSSGLRVKLFPQGNDSEKIEVAFFSGSAEEMSRLTLPSYLDVNSDWFWLRLGGQGMSDGTFVEDSGGFENYPNYYIYWNNTWQTMNVWEILKDKFPDTIQPPFFIKSDGGSQFLVTEENYCCDLVHTSPDRDAYRMQYVLQASYNEDGSGPKFTIVDERQISR